VGDARFPGREVAPGPGATPDGIERRLRWALVQALVVLVVLVAAVSYVLHWLPGTERAAPRGLVPRSEGRAVEPPGASTTTGAEDPAPGSSSDEADLPRFGDYVYVEELPEAIVRVAPEYPELAREAGVSGTVMVQALIGRDGTVRDTRVVKSIPMLDAVAERAVSRWRFKPAMAGGEPVAVWVGVPVKFSLK